MPAPATPPGDAQRAGPARYVAAFVALGVAVACVTVWSDAYRSGEAAAAAALVRRFDPASFASGDAFHVDSSDEGGLWFVITPECTTVVLLVPLVLFAAWALVQRRLRPAMALAGLVLGFTILVLLGTLRLATIGLAWRTWGDGSIWVTHTLVGTLISLAATLLALGLQATVTGLRSPALTRRFEEG